MSAIGHHHYQRPGLPWHALPLSSHLGDMPSSDDSEGLGLENSGASSWWAMQHATSAWLCMKLGVLGPGGLTASPFTSYDLASAVSPTVTAGPTNLLSFLSVFPRSSGGPGPPGLQGASVGLPAHLAPPLLPCHPSSLPCCVTLWEGNTLLGQSDSLNAYE